MITRCCLCLWALGVAGCGQSQGRPVSQPTVQTTVELPNARTIADVAAKVTPSVVSIFSERDVQGRAVHGDPAFDLYFGHLGDRSRRSERSLGSGVIISADGVIITNNHVVAQAGKIRVALTDGRELAATVVGTDPESDVAVLRVNARNLPAITLADSARARIGDLVLAIGNPFGIGQTVTMGIISATGRANIGITDYEDFIQTDAAINPGNSGGPLVDMNGRLIGINTAIVSRSGGYQGIGFAIPSNMVIQAKDSILVHGKVIRGWLGVATQEVTEDVARSLKLTPRTGVLVSDVTAGGPAALAGISRGDVILSIDGVKTNESIRLRNIIALAGKGKRVRIEVHRNGQTRNLDVVLAELPTDAGALMEESDIFDGVSVRELDDTARRLLRAPSQLRGIVVTEIDPRSAAAAMGLRVGDVIVEVNGVPTPSLEAFRRAAHASANDVVLLAYRDGTTLLMSRSRCGRSRTPCDRASARTSSVARSISRRSIYCVVCRFGYPD
jgi:serine protease Do